MRHRRANRTAIVDFEIGNIAHWGSEFVGLVLGICPRFDGHRAKHAHTSNGKVKLTCAINCSIFEHWIFRRFVSRFNVFARRTHTHTQTRAPIIFPYFAVGSCVPTFFSIDGVCLFCAYKFCLRKNIGWRREKKVCSHSAFWWRWETRAANAKKMPVDAIHNRAHAVFTHRSSVRSADYCHFVQHLTIPLLE